MQSSTIDAWMSETAESISRERDYLTQLDAAIGDGDHGINMDRGFTAVGKALAGKTLVSTVGGASGPLWGTALRRAGRALGDQQEFGDQDLHGALEAAVAGVVDLGAAAPGDKTMVDALRPAVDALGAAVESGAPLDEALESAASAAEEGAKATIPMQARKGRASYLGERSIGHQDPGATSAVLVIRALGRAVAAQG